MNKYQTECIKATISKGGFTIVDENRGLEVGDRLHCHYKIKSRWEDREVAFKPKAKGLGLLSMLSKRKEMFVLTGGTPTMVVVYLLEITAPANEKRVRSVVTSYPKRNSKDWLDDPTDLMVLMGEQKSPSWQTAQDNNLRVGDGVSGGAGAGDSWIEQPSHSPMAEAREVDENLNVAPLGVMAGTVISGAGSSATKLENDEPNAVVLENPDPSYVPTSSPSSNNGMSGNDDNGSNEINPVEEPSNGNGSGGSPEEPDAY